MVGVIYFFSDINIRRSVVTSAVDWNCEIYWIFFFFWHNIPQPDDRDGSVSSS